jgi:hypothetical protein
LPVAFTVVFTQAARAELIEAQDWYEGDASGLGRRFRQAIDVLAERMSENPRQFPIVFKNVRRALLRRFPYSFFLSWKTKPCWSSPVFMPAATLCNGKIEPEQISEPDWSLVASHFQIPDSGLTPRIIHRAFPVAP